MTIRSVDFTAASAPAEFVQSLHETGFGVLRHHPISEDLLNHVYDDWRKFFADDRKYEHQFQQGRQDGYFPKNISETAKGYDLKDIKEFYHFYPWGEFPSYLSDVTDQLYSEMSVLAGTLLEWIESESPESVAAKYSMPLSDMITDSPRTLLRILHYPPLAGDEPEGAIRAAAHEDINLITLLPAATEPGLQVKNSQGNWVDVPCDYGNIIVNVADMLQMASGHHFKSTTHRVVNPVGEESRKSRLSLPLFLHPRKDVRLSDTHTADDYLCERLRELGILQEGKLTTA